jgi:hypothetical protein
VLENPVVGEVVSPADQHVFRQMKQFHSQLREPWVNIETRRGPADRLSNAGEQPERIPDLGCNGLIQPNRPGLVNLPGSGPGDPRR